MRVRREAWVLALLGSFAFAGLAQAAAPTLLSVGHEKRHPTATFAMPGANDGTIYFATKPDRASDGEFLEENVKHLDLLTADEIQAGRWIDSSQIDPGRYYVLLRAYDFDCWIDASCMTGFSQVLPLSVAKPKIRYRGTVRAYRYLSRVRLGFRVRPLGERIHYRVCWRLASGRRRCARGAVMGYSWNRAATGWLTVRKRGMPRVAKFAWYVDGHRVAAKRHRIPFPPA